MLLFKYKALLLQGLTIVMATQWLSGCDPVVRDPWIEIVVHQINGQASFEFFIQRRTWWPNRTERVSTTVLSLTMGDSKGQTMWEIQTRYARVGVKEIKYGVVPEGFEQLFPREGNPTDLKIGDEYQVWAYSGGAGMTTFVYQGSKEAKKGTV